MSKPAVKKSLSREYREMGGGKKLVRDAEYELQIDGCRVARIVRGPDGWRACRLNGNNHFGLPISPIGMNKFRDVKAWVFYTVLEVKR
jgi:hypothetical protein